LQTDSSGKKLLPDATYGFDFEQMAFVLSPAGSFSASHIKLLRLAFASRSIDSLSHVVGAERLTEQCAELLRVMVQRMA
jgi:hypothetical protein